VSIFSVLAVEMVTLASVAVIEGDACLLSFLEYNHIVHRPIFLTVTQLVVVWQMFGFCWYGLLENDYF
jgi:hypothetical protein